MSTLRLAANPRRAHEGCRAPWRFTLHGGAYIKRSAPRKHSFQFKEEDFYPQEPIQDIRTDSLDREDLIFSDKEIIDNLCVIHQFNDESFLGSDFESQKDCSEISAFLKEFEGNTSSDNSYTSLFTDYIKPEKTHADYRAGLSLETPCTYPESQTLLTSFTPHDRSTTSPLESQATSEPCVKLPSYEQHMFNQFQHMVEAAGKQGVETFTATENCGMRSSGCYVPAFHPTPHPYYQHYLSQYNCQQCELNPYNGEYTDGCMHKYFANLLHDQFEEI